MVYLSFLIVSIVILLSLIKYVQLNATDTGTGREAQLTFAVLYKAGEIPVFDVRKINNNTAEIFTVRTFTRLSADIAALWFDDTVKLKLTVQVSDNGISPLSTICFTLVTIVDVNDNAPMFDSSTLTSYTTTVMWNVGAMTRIYRVFAADDDSGQNALITYSVVSQPSSCSGCLFTVDPNSGWIKSGSTIPASVRKC